MAVPPASTVSSGFSEYGQALGLYVSGRSNVRGAVLTDKFGDTVDFAHRPFQLDDLDVQILGAQVEDVTARIARWCREHDLGTCEILVEASHGLLLSAAVGRDCVLTTLHGHTTHADPIGQLAAFSALRRHIARMIG